MGSSVGNQSPLTPPLDTYKDCSQGLCSIYCPQWCYIIYPPPPYGPGGSGGGYGDDGDPAADFSPLIVGIVGIIASAFLLITYYAMVSKYCTRRGNRDSTLEFETFRESMNSEAWRGNSDGLDEALIKSITVCKYQKGLVEGTDCSVCLSEFQENESLRLLPKCNHAFHVPCIDTWLRSHSSCPLCRSDIMNIESLPHQEQVSVSVSVTSHQEGNNPEIPASGIDEQHRNDPVMENQDLERGGSQDLGRDDEIRGVRRSFSMNSLCHGSIVSVADILHEDDKEIGNGNIQISIGIESSHENLQKEEEVCSRRDKSLLEVRRTISAGRFMLPRYEKRKNNYMMTPNNHPVKI